MEDKYFKNLGSISGYDNYEKYSNEMCTNNTTKEERKKILLLRIMIINYSKIKK